MIIAVRIITFIGFHLNREFHHGNNVKSQKKPCSFRGNGLASIENEPATRVIKGSRLRILCLAGGENLRLWELAASCHQQGGHGLLGQGQQVHNSGPPTVQFGCHPS